MMKKIEKRILHDESITFDEALSLGQLPADRLPELLETAQKVNQFYNGRTMDLCSIVNAKAGRCSEDCKFCAQSIHWQTGIKESLPDEEMILERARQMENAGVKSYSLVTAGRGIKGNDFEKILKIYAALQNQTSLKLCASLGILNEEQLRRLKDLGVTTYHHNLETSRSFYRQICTTHSYEERLVTIKAAQKAGLRVCSGGIIGIGETWRDRVEMAFELRELAVDSVPINILHPIPGTPLEKQPTLAREEILKTLAVFRLILPRVMLRLAGGREYALGDSLPTALQSGVNALLVGSYLTTSGQTIEKDRELVAGLGFVF